MSDTVVWITGASSGIGAALAASVPWEGATTVDVSRSGGTPGAVHVAADLSDPASWSRVVRHVTATLADRRPTRAVLVHNAATLDPMGPAHAVDPDGYQRAVLLDSAAPQVLGAGFLAAVAGARSVTEAVLVVLTSGAASSVYEGWSAYGAGKAAVDQWVRTVGAEQRRQERPVRVVAVAPGVVDTAMQTAIRRTGDADFPAVERFRRLHADGQLTSPEDAAAGIWAVVQQPDLDTGSVVDLRGGR
ncbi:SDR family NAD(P)-dependent oxidoreductase [Euzebya sp.]|uniref:SDR family NAD(P)-dependent oxidoreductase n=1 Tax=Euzebya sp. TaxID=1971409 RepID=UPI0035177A71